MSDEQWVNDNKKKWSVQNRKSLKVACERTVDIEALDLSLLVTGEDQHHSSKPYPDFPDLKCPNDGQPFMAVDKNGIPAVVVLPSWLRPGAHGFLYDALMKFGRDISVDIKKAADKNTRDARASYTRRAHSAELHGVFQELPQLFAYDILSVKIKIQAFLAGQRSPTDELRLMQFFISVNIQYVSSVTVPKENIDPAR
ncbi:hypothetical protein AURDEDRAFT_174323 [Auricularia subglabra TFB-10046 SS5]|nr:hypothetical protein AURDEDRAFT_174323 [Auricularia subglabra TFB-10046 SS5]